VVESRKAGIRCHSARLAKCTHYVITTKCYESNSSDVRVWVARFSVPGLRRAELTRLKITDIDSARNVMHVQGGKGRKDRDVMISSSGYRRSFSCVSVCK